MKIPHPLTQHELLDLFRPRHLHDEDDGRCPGSSKTGSGTVLVGAVMGIANYVLYSLAMVFLARYVYSTHSFGDFSAAIAAVTVGATAGTLGLEKFLLKFVPTCRVRGEMDLLRGFRRFAPGAVFGISLLVSGVLLIVYFLSEPESALHHPSFLAGIGILPVVVLGSYFLEVTTADGAYLAGTVVYRIVFPGLILLGVWVVNAIHTPIVAVHAVLMWGACWAIVLILLLLISTLVTPKCERQGNRMFRRMEWMRHSSAFLSYSLLLSLMANTGVLVLGFVSANKEQTGVYAAVAQLGAVFIVIATAMNRWYGPQISRMIASNDVDGGQALLRSRRIIMWSIALVYALFIIILGRPVLGLFGSDYTIGYTALLIIGLGTVVSAVNSIAPVYIQYVGHEWTVPLMLIGGVLLAFALTIPGAFLFGLEGAAGGYAIATISLFVAFNLRARSIRLARLRKLGREDLRPLI